MGFGFWSKGLLRAESQDRGSSASLRCSRYSPYPDKSILKPIQFVFRRAFSSAYVLELLYYLNFMTTGS